MQLTRDTSALIIPSLTLMRAKRPNHLFDGTCRERGPCSEFATAYARGTAAGVTYAQHRDACNTCTDDELCDAGMVLARALAERVRA